MAEYAEFSGLGYVIWCYALTCALRDFVRAAQAIMNIMRKMVTSEVAAASVPPVEKGEKISQGLQPEPDTLEYVYQLTAAHKVHLYRTCIPGGTTIQGSRICSNCLKKFYKNR
jgi:hypothetical protein